MAREYSNKKINKAGEILSDGISEDKGAGVVLTYWRTLHNEVLEEFELILAKKIKILSSEPLIAKRLKRVSSIIMKLKRQDTMKLSTMQDIVGIRVVLDDVSAVYKLVNEFRNSDLGSFNIVRENDYIIAQKDSGYRSFHIVFTYKKDESESNNLKIELQIRTQKQHTWATTVETIGSLLNFSLKSSQGPQNWLDFFKIVSKGYSILESQKETLSDEDKEVMNKIESISQKLEVEKMIRGLNVATKHISEFEKSVAYTLISLDMNKRMVSIKRFKSYQYKRANQEYTSKEREIKTGKPIQVVLVSVDTLDKLREAYPNYFLDTDKFVIDLESMLALASSQ